MKNEYVIKKIFHDYEIKTKLGKNIYDIILNLYHGCNEKNSILFYLSWNIVKKIIKYYIKKMKFTFCDLHIFVFETKKDENIYLNLIKMNKQITYLPTLKSLNIEKKYKNDSFNLKNYYYRILKFNNNFWKNIFRTIKIFF